jgi:hypothetical protein
MNLTNKEINAIINLIDVLLDSRTSLEESTKEAIILILQIIGDKVK